jgi:hypothetical protein
MPASTTDRQQGWLGKVAAGLTHSKVLCTASRAAGSLDCGRPPAAFWRQPCCRDTGLPLATTPSRYRVGEAAYWDARLND